MTRSRLHLLVLALCACSVGPAFAGSGDITKRDQNSGSVELSNLGDEEAPVVVSAPARPAIQAAVRPAPGAVAPAPAREAAAPEQSADSQQARKPACEKENAEAASRDSKERGDCARGASGSGSYNRDTYAANGGSSGAYGYGGGSTSTGSGSSGFDTGPGGSTPNGTPGSPNGSPGTGGGPEKIPYRDPTPALGLAPPGGALPGDTSPRWENLKQIMLDEPRGSNGQVPNPAKLRRYTNPHY